MDVADLFEIQERNCLMWEQQGRGAWVKATRDWLKAMRPLRKFFQERASDQARTITYTPSLPH